MFLHDHLLVCEITTVKTLALRTYVNQPKHSHQTPHIYMYLYMPTLVLTLARPV